MPADYRLRGQAAVVTGSTSGIGQALAEALAAEGVDIVLNGLGDPEQIEADRRRIAAQTGVRVLHHPADMRQPDQIADLVACAHREFGRLDILVNNAGVQHVAAVEEFPVDKWDAILAINLTSAFHTTRAALPIMKAQGRGRIVNLASAHGLVASPFKSAYVAAKHGLVGFTKSCALEVARAGITVNAICPGYVKTPLVEMQIADQARTRGLPEARVIDEVILAAQPNRAFVTYDQLAGLMLYLVSDMGAGVTGAAYALDGGWTAA
ncbi:3-hydroxybutyrate dehydrogenase [Phenylobacterium sp.]|jgi:3-hydroxybutyrate dehydrogenase|uniref:3-hydroxybutyrate dehydrogenase n=1 Tax=Phenylobacterium sp. TaxID=1871053 RepID=UPI00378442B9